MKLWKKTMLLAFCVAMTAAISSCDMISGMLGGGESDTGSSVEAPASESTPATSEPDSESTSDSTSEEDDHDHDETNIWMLFSSIAVAAVLVFAIVAIFVRKGVEKYHKKHGIKIKKAKK